MSEESFEEWFSLALRLKMANLPYNRDSLIKDAWKHQQSKLDQKDKRIVELEELLREGCKQITHVTDVADTNLTEWFNDDIVECRGDEDCDHCNQISVSYYAKYFLNKPEIKKIMSEGE